jgi:hypothetical protein
VLAGIWSLYCIWHDWSRKRATAALDFLTRLAKPNPHAAHATEGEKRKTVYLIHQARTDRVPPVSSFLRFLLFISATNELRVTLN